MNSQSIPSSAFEDQITEIREAIKKAPEDLSRRKALLDDLKLSICREAARAANARPDETLLWSFAHEMPDFDTGTLYHTRASLLSLASAILLGWFIGGLLSTLLGFLGLGGEIIRPAAILATLWIEDYLGANARARKIVLTVMGFGALARFATAIIGGVGRLASMGGIRQLIFGAGRAPNVFKAAWLWFGAIFLYVFFAKKITSLDLAAFSESLEQQIRQKYDLMHLVFEELEVRDRKLGLQDQSDRSKPKCSSRDCPLASGVLSLLPTLPDEQARFLSSSLRLAGIEVLDSDQNFLVWDDAIHGDKYDALGLIADGDKALILEWPQYHEGSLIKGRVQRVAS